MKIRIELTRLAFPALFEAKTVNGEGEPAFSACFLLPLGHPAIKQIEEALPKIAAEKWGAKGPAILEAMKKADKTALHDGNLKSEYDGFAGMMYVSARSKTRPTVLDQQKAPLTAADGKPYGGCYVNAVIQLWPQDNSYGKRINAQLMGVQFVKDGDSFGGAQPASADDFEEVAAGANAEDFV